MPPGVVTRTLAGPDVEVVGVRHVRLVALVIFKLVQALPRTATEVVPVKLVPVTVIVLPAIGPELGDTPVTVGGGTKVYRVLAVLVPPGVVTRTLAVPAVLAGVVQVMLVALTTLKLVQAVPPTVTAVAPVKLVPVRVMLVPPAVGPALGERAVTVGTAAYL